MNYRKQILDLLIPHFERDETYHLLVCDMGFGSYDQIRLRFPNRVTNAGIMEQSTVGIAAGMAIGGMVPVVYSIVNFICFRAIEQVRNDIILQGLNVKLIGTGANDYFEKLGRSHTCARDDVKIMELVKMPIFDPYEMNRGSISFSQMVDTWITSDKAGYLRV